MQPDNQAAISVDQITKIFKLPYEKTNSIKSLFVNIFRRNKGYELQYALRDISFEINKGEFFGIVGRNGSGKSTMLKTLAGIYTPNHGMVTVRGRLTPFIELGVGFNMELTGRENVFLNGALLGFNRKEMLAMYDDIVEFAEISRFMDQKLKNYSSGMQVRLAFSIAIRAQSDILLVDEVLAVGDEAFQRKCFEYFKTLKDNNKTVVFVSHDMNSVRNFCDRGIFIENGKIKLMGTAKEIADAYSKSFRDEAAKANIKRKDEREGTGEAKVIKASASVKADGILINSKIKAHKDFDGLQYGIRIIAEDGQEICAMNNRMLRLPDIGSVAKGEEIDFEWRLQDIFSSGRYIVRLSISEKDGPTLDDLFHATNFVIKKSERSNSWILPPLKVSHNAKKAK